MAGAGVVIRGGGCAGKPSSRKPDKADASVAAPPASVLAQRSKLLRANHLSGTGFRRCRWSRKKHARTPKRPQ